MDFFTLYSGHIEQGQEHSVSYSTTLCLLLRAHASSEVTHDDKKLERILRLVLRPMHASLRYGCKLSCSLLCMGIQGNRDSYKT